ncbi:MAG: hypothetical protein M1835_005622 [Candelina submexicana]|nr:MAG: hypothetical protein M1835_005622 [Candelina submexicana]
MGKAGRLRRLLEYQKGNQTISFSVIPGEIRNLIYDAIILLAYGTSTPTFECKTTWCSTSLEMDGPYSPRISQRNAYRYLQHQEIAPWQGFRVSNGQIYQQFSGRLIAATSFIDVNPRPLIGTLAVMPQFLNIQCLELDAGMACHDQNRYLIDEANAEIRKKYTLAGCGGYWGPHAFDRRKFQAFRLQAAADVGEQVLTIAGKLQLKTLVIDVDSLQDKREQLYRDRREWSFVQKIASLASTGLPVWLVGFGLTQSGERVTLTTAVDLQSLRVQLDPAPMSSSASTSSQNV